MLSIHNSHLGFIPHFVLPVGITCPGATEWCKKHCYAKRGYFLCPSVKKRAYRNYELSKRDDFVELMCDALRYVCSYLRVHTAGDFYSQDYIQKWKEIATKNKRIKFLAFTKAWRVPDLLDDLLDLASLDNFVIYASTDSTSGKPPEELLEAASCEPFREAKVCVKKKSVCASCLYCFEGRGNVVFR